MSVVLSRSGVSAPDGSSLGNMWFANEVRIVAAMITIDTQRGLYDSHLYDQDDLAEHSILRISLPSDGVSGAGIDGWTNFFPVLGTQTTTNCSGGHFGCRAD